MLQAIPGLDVHWGLVFGVIACIVAYVLMMRTVFGFGAAIGAATCARRMLSGLPVRRMIVIAVVSGRRRRGPGGDGGGGGRARHARTRRS